MNSVNNVFVEISVVLGRTTLPIHQLLKMGRGAVIELDSRSEDEIWLLANNVPIARGEIVVQGDKIAVSITDTLKSFA
ncbi:MAG TPA: FliM/FliN family flagellar motor switch protein [Parvibaculum sp.]